MDRGAADFSMDFARKRKCLAIFRRKAEDCWLMSRGAGRRLRVLPTKTTQPGLIPRFVPLRARFPLAKRLRVTEMAETLTDRYLYVPRRDNSWKLLGVILCSVIRLIHRAARLT